MEQIFVTTNKNIFVGSIIKDFVRRIKTGWSFPKIIRVGLGLFVLGASLAENDLTGIVIGLLFTFFAISSNACCAGSCTPVGSHDQKKVNS